MVYMHSSIFLPDTSYFPSTLKVLARNREASRRLGLVLPPKAALQAATSDMPLLAALAHLTPAEVHRCCRDLGLVPPEHHQQQQRQQQEGMGEAEQQQQRRAVAEALRSSFLGRAVKQRTEEGARAAVRSAVAASVPSLAADAPSSSSSLYSLLGAQAPRGP